MMSFYAKALAPCIVWILCVGSVYADGLVDAQSLLENGQYQQAYESLKKDEDRYLGTAEFDKLLAQAATAGGLPNEATVALERLLQLDPNAVAARAELAKLYFAMSNYEQARHQFNRILAGTTNAGMVQDAQTHLAAIDEKLAKRRKRPNFDPQLAARPVPTPIAATPIQPVAKTDLKAVMANARQLLHSAQPVAAYEALIAHEFEGSGDIEYDYLVGTTAIDAGKPDKATLALERVLAMDPNFAGARIDMGRAYMLLGNSIQAREEFDNVMRLNPPDPVKRQLERFVAEIEQQTQVAKTTWNGFFGISFGRDSNVNSAPADAEQYIPLFGYSVPLDESSLRTPSNYLGLSGRVQVNHQVSDAVGVYAALDLDSQRNFQASQFDRTAADLRLGSIFKFSNQELELSLVTGKTYLEQYHYRNLVGGGIQWRLKVGENHQLQGVAQFNRLSYPQRDVSVFDTDQTLIGVNWISMFGSNKEGLAFIAGYRGKETAPNGNPSGAKDFYGVRFGGQWGFNSKWALFSTFGIALADYDAIELSQQKSRADAQFDWTFGTNYVLWENWSLRPQINLTRRDSNIGLYDFERREISITLRREWR
jgi:outer membrane protein